MKNYLNLKSISIWLIALICVIGGVIFAGSLTPPGSPDTATFYTLGDIYSKLTDNTYTNTEGNHDLSTTTAPTGTFATLKDIYEAIPTIDYSKMLDTYGLMGATGTIPTQTLDNSTTTVPAGYYEATDLATVDTDLTAGNIKSGTTIFGVAGSLAGAPSIVWSGSDDYSGHTDWNTAVSTCAGKTTGGYTWRLPTSLELHKLYLDSNGTPAGFTSDYYWSGTTHPLGSGSAYYVFMVAGFVGSYSKDNPDFLVRCVRDQ